MADPGEINEYLQQRLRELGMAEVPAVEAARWLDEAGLLTDSTSRPGLPLRNLLRDGLIPAAEQRPPRANGRWFIIGRSITPGDPLQPDPPVSEAEGSGPAVAQAQVVGDVTRESLTAGVFEGFARFKGADLSRIPQRAGVYVVLRERSGRPKFLDRNPVGWFKDNDPTVPVAELEAAWPEGSTCVYIGKAGPGASGNRGLRKRIKEFRQFGDGKPVGHSGGRRIWQLADADDYVIAWRTTGADDPGDLEGAMLRGFLAVHGKLPIGNQNAGRRPAG